MKFYRRKQFSGLVRYGQARHAMLSDLAKGLKRLEQSGSYTLLEAMESRIVLQRRYRKVTA